MQIGKTLSIVTVAVLSLLVACKREEPPKPATHKPQELITESRSYTDPAHQAAFRAALEQEGIPFKLSQRADGREQVEWSGEHSIRVSRIEERLFPDNKPKLRSLGLDSREAKKLTDWLKKQKISHEVISRQGQDYVIWRESDHDKVVKSGLVPKD